MNDTTGDRTRNENSGIVGGDLVQTETVILRQQAPPPNVRPNNLPPSTLFVGRAAEAKELRDWVETSQDDGTVVVLVSGAGGVGSSAFAVEWGHRTWEELFPDGVLYADLRGARTDEGVAVSDVLAVFLQECGWQADQIPASLAARQARFRSWTATRRALVVVDHVTGEAEVELLRPNSRSCAMIVTSHRQDEFVANLKYRPLQPLNDTESKTLLVKLLGEERVAAEKPQAARLVRLLGGVPAALCMAVALMRRRPHMTLATLVSDVERLLLDTYVRSGQPIIDGMANRSYRSLSDDAAWTYRRLAWHPDLNVPRDVLVALVDESGRDGDTAVEELLDHHLIDEAQPGCFEVHPLVKAHARRKAADLEDDATDIARWCDVYLRFARAADHLTTPRRLRQIDEPPTVDVPFHDATSAMNWLDAWRHNLTAMQRAAADHARHDIVYLFADAMYPFYMNSPYLVEMLESAQLGLAAARAAEHRTAEGRMGRFVARALMEHGDHDAAAAHLADAVALLDNTETRLLWASAIEFQGRLLRRQGRFDDARERHHRARRVFEDAGDRRGVALQEHFIGQNLLDNAEYEPAVEYLRAAQDRLLNTGHDRDVAKIRTDLGRALHADGDLQGAREALVKAANLLADVNARRYEATALLRLAAVTEDEDDVTLTRQALERVRDLYAVIGHTDLAAIQERLNQLGDTDTANH